MSRSLTVKTIVLREVEQTWSVTIPDHISVEEAMEKIDHGKVYYVFDNLDYSLDHEEEIRERSIRILSAEKV